MKRSETPALQFCCSHCEQALECESRYVGQDVQCPLCQQLTRVPIIPPPLGKYFSGALVSFILAAGSWTVAILVWAWVTTRPPGTFNDQGGMIITFGVLPLMLLCWVIGGPTASMAGHQAIRQIRAGGRPENERSLARTGILLSWMMTLTGVGAVLWGLAVEFSR